jgi:hypothetical protein
VAFPLVELPSQAEVQSRHPEATQLYPADLQSKESADRYR